MPAVTTEVNATMSVFDTEAISPLNAQPCARFEAVPTEINAAFKHGDDGVYPKPVVTSLEESADPDVTRPFVLNVTFGNVPPEDTAFNAKMPALLIVASPDNTTPVALLECLPTKMLAEVNAFEAGV